MSSDIQLPLINESIVTHQGVTYGMARASTGEKHLAVSGDGLGFEGGNGGLYPLTPANAKALRERLTWLKAVPLGLQTSAGFGDRLGIATPGHVAATRGTGVAPIFAQQSVRENTRTGRAPQQVMDDAMWGVFEAGWRDAWGGDADHIKTVESVDAFVAAGYTFYTIDPGDHVDDMAETDDLPTLRQKAAALDWNALDTTLEETKSRYIQAFDLGTSSLTFDEYALMKALAKYGRAVIHTLSIAQHLQQALGDKGFDLEMSVDETGTTTSLHEHFYIASELLRLGVPVVSLAPRFVGRFEKGVDYIGDLGELDENIAGHAAIMRYFDNRYKLSLHTGSDKFGVYPIAMRHTGGLVHLKTAGTSYLEALRLLAAVEPAQFRSILDFARARYEDDRKTYHVSAQLEKVPASADLTDAQLPDLLNQFDARQVLHVTFGSVLDDYGTELHQFLRTHEADYHRYIQAHFAKHLQAFAR